MESQKVRSESTSRGPTNAHRRVRYSLVVASLVSVSLLAATPGQSWGAGVIHTPASVIHTPPKSIGTRPPMAVPLTAGIHAASTVATATPNFGSSVIKPEFHLLSPVQPPSTFTAGSVATTGPALHPASAPGGQPTSAVTSIASTPSAIQLTPSVTPTPSAPQAFSQVPSTYIPTAPCPLGAPACASR
jgi:hypothetical protein